MSSTRYYVFNNTHGRLTHMQDNFEKITTDLKQNVASDYQIVILGNIIDYGPSSKSVIDYLQQPHDHSARTTLILGNHEHMLLNFMGEIENGPLWLTHGGLNTLESYGIEYYDYSEAMEELHILQQSLTEIIPEEHLRFLQNLKPNLETDDFIFSHAGINNNYSLSDHPAEDFLWPDATDSSAPHPSGKKIVYARDKLTELQIESNHILLPGGHSTRVSRGCFVLSNDDEPREVLLPPLSL